MEMPADPAIQDSDWRHIAGIQWLFRCGLIALATFECWNSRFIMNPDGVSYQDIGDRYWLHDWNAAVSAYWSPLYSWMIALWLHTARPSIRWEYPAVHLLTVPIFIGALLAFELLWRELLRWNPEKNSSSLSASLAWAFGYLLFAFIHLVFHPLEFITPDLIVAAVVYLASGWMLQFATKRLSISRAILLGVALGCGYLAKTAMFPFALVVLGTMVVVAWKLRAGARPWAAAALGFFLISTPFIAAIHHKYHRLTIGDAGKLNVGWVVNADNAEYADPLHQTHLLSGVPEVFSFAGPIVGTLPMWYDPTYWCNGIDTHFYLRNVLATFLRNAAQMAGELTLETGMLTTVVLFLFLASDDIALASRRLLTLWPVLVPAGAGITMYLLISLKARYYSGFLAVICAAVAATSMIQNDEPRRKVLRAASVAFGSVTAITFLWVVVTSHTKSVRSAEAVQVAQQLGVMGLQPSESVALIGDGYEEANWARLGRFTIIAEVPKDNDAANAFWSSTAADQDRVLQLLRRTGARAVVAEVRPATLSQGWEPVSGTYYAVHFF